MDFDELLKELKTYFDNKHDLFSENIEYLEKLISTKNEVALQNCGMRLRYILEIILFSFGEKINSNLFADDLLDEKIK